MLRHLNYKAWFALAEFVDNSLQSYLDKRAALERVHGPDFKLRVRIDFEAGGLLAHLNQGQRRGYRAPGVPARVSAGRSPDGPNGPLRVRYGHEERLVLVLP